VHESVPKVTTLRPLALDDSRRNFREYLKKISPLRG
jgi:hypothetical protein